MFLYVKILLIILLVIVILFANKISGLLVGSSNDIIKLNIFKVILGIFVLLLFLDVIGVVNVLPD